MKRGYQTSEFWLTLGSLIATVTGVIYGVLPKTPATIVVGAIVIGYCIGRGIAKQNYDENSNDCNHTGYWPHG
jgi:hypothetical protein